MANERQNPDELGALWVKESRRGKYLTGTIAGQRVVVFKNERKSNERQPDWRVLKAKPRDAAPADDDFGPDYEGE